jgi:glycosyltransferase involved in cell wall biosynthesis
MNMLNWSDTMTNSLIRVAFVDHSGLPGGGQLGLQRYLSQTHSIEAAVFILGPGHAFDALPEAGVQVHRLSGRSGTAEQFLLARKLAVAIRRFAPQLVIANSTRAAGVLAITRLPRRTVRVDHLRDDLNPQRNSLAKRVLMGNVILPAYDAYISNSEWTRSTLPAKVTRDKPSLVAHPVSGVEPRGEIKQRAETPVRFLSMSRLDSWKGVDTFIAAAQILERRGYGGRFSVRIAGSSAHSHPAYAAQLRQSASALATGVEFLGHVEDVRSTLEQSDVLISASKSPEPFGQVVVQGLAYGLTVISSNHGGPVEILADGAGYLVEPASAAALADAMAALIDDPSRMKGYSEKALARAAVYADSATVASMDHAIQSIARLCAKHESRAADSRAGNSQR